MAEWSGGAARNEAEKNARPNSILYCVCHGTGFGNACSTSCLGRCSKGPVWLGTKFVPHRFSVSFKLFRSSDSWRFCKMDRRTSPCCSSQRRMASVRIFFLGFVNAFYGRFVSWALWDAQRRRSRWDLRVRVSSPNRPIRLRSWQLLHKWMWWWMWQQQQLGTSQSNDVASVQLEAIAIFKILYFFYKFHMFLVFACGLGLESGTCRIEGLRP